MPSSSLETSLTLACGHMRDNESILPTGYLTSLSHPLATIMRQLTKGEIKKFMSYLTCWGR